MLTETRNYGENNLSPFVVGQNCLMDIPSCKENW